MKTYRVFNYVPRRKDVWGGGVCPRILKPWHYVEVGSRLHAPATVPSGKEPRYPFDRSLGGPQIQSGCGVQKN